MRHSLGDLASRSSPLSHGCVAAGAAALCWMWGMAQCCFSTPLPGTSTPTAMRCCPQLGFPRGLPPLPFPCFAGEPGPGWLTWAWCGGAIGPRGVAAAIHGFRAKAQSDHCACACLFSSAMGCTARLDLVGVVASGCFAASTFFFDIVASPSWTYALLLKVSWPSPRYGCCHRGCLLPGWNHGRAGP